MNFAELRFWGLLALGLCLALALRPFVGVANRGRYDRASLAAIGFVLLAAVSLQTFLTYLFVIGVTWAGLRWIVAGGGARRIWVPLLVMIQFAPLLFFKYSRFLTADVLGRTGWVPADLAIPVGISFYTFQVAGFMVDTLVRGQPIPRLVDYLNFAGFFPQLVAGPIERREDLLPQVERFSFRWSGAAVADGASWLVVGLFFKMCLADNLANFIQRDTGPNAYLVWTNNVLFALRIYFDFAGYSLVALGLGRALGIRLTLNFASPYLASSPGEFWRRWHITLSQWFRDYVYIPLGGNRVRRWALNILIVFGVSGLWHGAGWNFIAWGLFHGVLLVVAARGWPKGSRWGWVGRGLTLVAVLFSWLLFYETRPEVLTDAVRTLVSPGGYSAGALRAWVGWLKSANGMVAAAFLALSGFSFVLEALSLRRGDVYGEFRKPWVQAILVMATVWLSPGVSNGFIYFAF